ncbi:2'-5'-oligoadenylate synthetase [Mytilus galloprovincialis]|uniref:2'-5'-oligoadenylate synthetase n=1 Tax=Mytilus galloprovincialis TaxID=29158 RepID=A0A8B6FUC6_MYTGA|nr:2'-5'-oligoadenylate synthetase [Mytilus galloprovincialis]
MVFFDGMLPDESLEKFLEREVRPDIEFLNDCNQVIDTVVKLVHRHPKYSVNQVIKGGSIGKGTAIRGHIDVNLFVVLNNFKSVEHLKESMENVIHHFRDYLKPAVEREGSNIEIRIMGQTPLTLQFDLRSSDDSPWFDVDLIPIVDVWSSWLLGFAGGVQSTYSTMELKPHLRKYYAKSLAKLQIEFVKSMPTKVKDLICLLKYWKYTEEVQLTSYCIELLVIHIWRENGKPNNFTMKQLMIKVVGLLVTFGESTISFSDHYAPSDYIQELGRTPPYVLDPSNPYQDVASDPNISTDCSRIESKGKQLQRKLDGLSEFSELSEESGCVVS